MNAGLFKDAAAAIGRGDYATAVRLFRMLADQGDVSAQGELGFLYSRGLGVPQDTAEALRLYRLAAEQGLPSAQFNIGVMYYKGRGVQKDHVAALKWYRLAAEQGYSDAQHNLGVMYAAGEGVPQDYVEAARWHMLAAEKGDSLAQNSLGLMYANGRGVPQDSAEAVKWYRLAAEQDNADAQWNLAHMYARGQGVLRDYAEAARWHRLAIEKGASIMQDWMLPKLIDYWDTRVEAIDHFSHVLDAIPPADRKNHLLQIGAAIRRHVDGLSDEELTLAAFIIADDLYKTASHLTHWDDALEQYLAASGDAFFVALTKRGYSVNYFVDNTYPTLTGPAHWFRVFFQTVSVGYICPQEIACRMVEKDRPEAEWPMLVSKYIEISRPAANKLADAFYRDGKSFVFLDIDATDFSIAQKTQEKLGVVHVFRQEAPEPGSRCIFTKPPGPRSSALSSPMK